MEKVTLNNLLYPAFKHWIRENGNVYFISDTHFTDNDMILPTSVRSNFKTVEEMDDHIITSINKVCKRNDTLVILGDIGNPECLKRLKAGYKVLIKGNHDKVALYEPYFDEIYKGAVTINDKLLLSHEWYSTIHMFNVCGHHHELTFPYSEVTPNSVMCVVSERINYTPISLKTIMSVKKNIINIHDYYIKQRL